MVVASLKAEGGRGARVVSCAWLARAPCEARTAWVSQTSRTRARLTWTPQRAAGQGMAFALWNPWCASQAVCQGASCVCRCGRQLDREEPRQYHERGSCSQGSTRRLRQAVTPPKHTLRAALTLPNTRGGATTHGLRGTNPKKTHTQPNNPTLHAQHPPTRVRRLLSSTKVVVLLQNAKLASCLLLSAAFITRRPG